MKLKGPVFPSYLKQGAARPSRMQWKAHCGTRASMRNLRHKCHRFLVSDEPEIAFQRERVRAATEEEPSPEFGLLHLLCAAVDISEATGESWEVCMKYIMDKYDGQAQAA